LSLDMLLGNVLACESEMPHDHFTIPQRIIELAQRGERDPIRLREAAVKGI
jgi:hypothetical protein